MTIIETDRLSYTYGRHDAVHDITLRVPEGACYALVGPNGAGKTTLLQLLMGLRVASRGSASMLGTRVERLSMAQRARVSYVAEGVRLPQWMRLSELERWLAPLYPSWDRTLADRLRARFALDPSRKLSTFSRGEQMKAALLCALAPRPRILLMDEPFTGLDVMVKDELVRGLLDSSGEEGWTVLISSHDIAELELLCDWVGVLTKGRLLLSSPMEETRERFRRIEITAPHGEIRVPASMPAEWMDVAVAGRRLSFVLDRSRAPGDVRAMAEQFASSATVAEQELSLKELFVAVAGNAERAS